MDVVFDGDLEALFSQALQYFSDSVEEIISKKGYVVLAIPGGRSLKPLFNLFRNARLPWKRIHIFMVDERFVPLNDKDSNFLLAKESFIDHLFSEGLLPIENVHPFQPDKGVEQYKSELDKFGGCFDIVLLGVGTDGHVAALFPDGSINNDSESFIVFEDSPKPPSKRMSSSRKLLLRSKLVFVFVIGEGKRKAYDCFQDGSVSVEQCPVRLVKEMSGFLFTDMQ